jgi:hypothetical protein
MHAHEIAAAIQKIVNDAGTPDAGVVADLGEGWGDHIMGVTPHPDRLDLVVKRRHVTRSVDLLRLLDAADGNLPVHLDGQEVRNVFLVPQGWDYRIALSTTASYQDRFGTLTPTSFPDLLADFPGDAKRIRELGQPDQALAIRLAHEARVAIPVVGKAVKAALGKGAKSVPAALAPILEALGYDAIAYAFIGAYGVADALGLDPTGTHLADLAKKRYHKDRQRAARGLGHRTDGLIILEFIAFDDDEIARALDEEDDTTTAVACALVGRKGQAALELFVDVLDICTDEGLAAVAERIAKAKPWNHMPWVVALQAEAQARGEDGVMEILIADLACRKGGKATLRTFLDHPDLSPLSREMAATYVEPC